MLANYAKTALTSAIPYSKRLRELQIGTNTIKSAIVDNFDWFVFKDSLGKYIVVPVWAIAWNPKKMVCETRQNKRTKDYRGNVVDLAYTVDIKPSVWVIPSYENVQLKRPIQIPATVCDKVHPVETNGYFKDFDIAKLFIQNGYEPFNILHGIKIEERYPILKDSLDIEINQEDKIQDIAWKVAEIYAEKIKETKKIQTQTNGKIKGLYL